jgi:hypothetical protein
MQALESIVYRSEIGATRYVVDFFQTTDHSVEGWLRFDGCDWAAVAGAGCGVNENGRQGRPFFVLPSFCGKVESTAKRRQPDTSGISRVTR